MNIKELAEQAGLLNHEFVYVAHELELEAFAELVASAEQEACAKVCEEMLSEPMLVGWNGFQHYMTQCAKRIRARGDKHE